jgi:hypothetical protein
MQYADDLAKAIQEAGCKLRRPKFLIDTSPSYGLSVVLHDTDSIPAGADALADAFVKAGVSVKSGTSDAIEPSVIYLMVLFNEAKQ